MSNVCSSGLMVYCTDIADAHEIYATAFEESIDEIIVWSVYKNTALNRGWIGDLSYKTRYTQNIDGRTVTNTTDTWKDVLLVNVRLSASTGEANTFEYRFSKK